MREPVRFLALLAVLLGGLFALKSLSLFNDVLDFMTAEAAAQEIEAGTDSDSAALQESGQAEAEPIESAEAEAGMSDQCAVENANAAFIQRTGVSPYEVDILTALSDRQQEIENQAAELETREALIMAMEQRVDRRIEELRMLETDINTLIGELSEREAAEMTRIVAMLTNMDPEQAAPILMNMDPQTQIQVASVMAERLMGPILAAMPAAQAADLTMRLAQRHDLPDTAGELEARLGSNG
ncbi:MotE family protein [Maricaulis sp. D1M11]|uniref:MotE family protein n=1 Tax=Maricaulis sp. D1M11 TaxID=3076117 RepID=UPI0039B51402